jgi:hypothetical protein
MIATALRNAGFKRYVARCKPPISIKNQKRRLAFAIEHVNWTWDQWARILWSDETWVTGNHHRRTWVTRRPYEAYDATCIVPKVPRKPGWMFWGCFHGSTKGPKVFWEKSWGSISAVTYGNYVVPVVANYMHNHPGLVFQQDNAGAHDARATRQKLEQLGITVIDWPAYSPDLSPIESVWDIMKDWIEGVYGDVERFNLAELRDYVAQAWDHVTSEQREELLNTMQARCQAVIDVNGLYTKF